MRIRSAAAIRRAMSAMSAMRMKTMVPTPPALRNVAKIVILAEATLLVIAVDRKATVAIFAKKPALPLRRIGMPTER